MKGHSPWSYTPCRMPFWEVGEVYICRIVPSETAVRLEWLPCGEVKVYFRKRGEGEFALAGSTSVSFFELTGLDGYTDYEFYAQSDCGRSRIRLARTGKTVGTVVNYLHPDDEAYAFSGRYLCSPSLLIHPDGYMLASMDLFAGGMPQNLTLIFRSDDGGKSWYYLCELCPCFWGKLFYHNGGIYMFAVSTEYGDLLIARSDDGGRSFSSPVALLRATNGKGGHGGIHKAPQNTLIHNGRLYTAIEWGSWANRDYGHSAIVASVGVDDDLLRPESWSFTEPVRFSPDFAPELADLSMPVMTIEGTVALTPEGELVDLMRFGKRGYMLAYAVDPADPEAPLTYKEIIPFEANFSKFTVRFDPVSKKYYSVATRLYEGCPDNARDLLSLMVSDNLKTWSVLCDLLDYRGIDTKSIGFQYVDFNFDGDDLVYLCRTAFNGAHNFHDANFSTFHRVENFRKL